MDGNGRWAKKRGLPRSAGHKKGIDALKRAVQITAKLGVKVLSVYVFSTENWKRPQDEVSFLMKLFEGQIDKQVEELHQNNVRVCFLGRLHELSPILQKKIQSSQDKTALNTGVRLNVMINYGGRQELLDSIRALASQVQDHQLLPQDITMDTVASSLYTRDCPDPELLIRTSGEFRISNFMLWQISYSEVYVTDTLWPDFDEPEYAQALGWYATRERRFGGV